ncbi:hypothetical protein Taro_008660 [Colocasia esculenta]|uniref:Uncharacterized protein n=1 Tax=Colocasia esculenta TaxID=4460 RepID=A0A843TYU3_COLES|nr:hypothetical protein [Colocasia esculenta]
MQVACRRGPMVDPREVSRLLIGLNCGRPLERIILPEPVGTLSSSPDFDMQILTGFGYGSVLVFSTLDINSGLASKWVTSTLCWRPWVAVNMFLASIDVDVYRKPEPSSFPIFSSPLSPPFTFVPLHYFRQLTGARGKAVMRAVAADQAGNDGLEGGVRRKLLGVSARFEVL